MIFTLSLSSLSKELSIYHILEVTEAYYNAERNSETVWAIWSVIYLQSTCKEDFILYLTTEVEADHPNIYDKIRRLEAGLKY